MLLIPLHVSLFRHESIRIILFTHAAQIPLLTPDDTLNRLSLASPSQPLPNTVIATILSPSQICHQQARLPNPRCQAPAYSYGPRLAHGNWSCKPKGKPSAINRIAPPATHASASATSQTALVSRAWRLQIPYIQPRMNHDDDVCPGYQTFAACIVVPSSSVDRSSQPRSLAVLFSSRLVSCLVFSPT